MVTLEWYHSSVMVTLERYLTRVMVPIQRLVAFQFLEIDWIHELSAFSIFLI